MRPLTMLFSALMLFALTNMHAQKITGYVYDQHNQPLPGANVAIQDADRGDQTNRNGQFEISIEPGTHTVRASFTGYEPVRKEVTVNADETVRLDIRLRQQLMKLESVTIKGVRAGEDAPIAQTTINKQQIEDEFAGQDAQFILSETAPSIVTYSEAGTNFSNYGGMRMRGIDQTRINITLNGVPLNDMLDQGVFFSNFTDFANSMESVQVQRGVGFSTNGTASYAGSINFESEQIRQPNPEANVQLNAGSFNTYRASAEVESGMIEDKFAFYGRMTNFTTDGYRYHSGTDAWSMFFSGGYFGEKDMLKVNAFNGRTKSNLAYFPVPQPLIDDDPRTNLNYPQDRDNFGQYFTQVQYTRFASEELSFSGSAYVGGAGGDFPFGLDSNFATSGPLAQQINYPLTNEHYGFFGNVNYLGEKLSLKGGIHTYLFQRRNWEYIIPNSTMTIYDDSSSKDEISAFVNAEYNFGRLTVFGDVQVRSTNMQFHPDYRFISQAADIPTYNYTFVNPKIGLNYNITESLSAYASFGRTGREPTKFDIFGSSTRLDSTNLAAVQDENTIKPEFVNDFEGGVRYRSENFSGRVNLFWMDFRNKIEPIGERLVFVQLRKNMPQSYRRGVEIEGRWQSDAGLYLNGFLSIIDARIEEYAPDNRPTDEVFENVRPALTPPFLGQLTAGYNWNDQMEISITGRYTEEMYIEPTNQENLTVPSSFVLDARLSWNFWKDHQLVLQAGNLFDALYYTYGEVGSHQGETVPAYYVQPPRNVNVMLNMRF